MAKIDRRCWWCNSRLTDVNHAVIKQEDGYDVIVHCCCKEPAEQHVRSSRMTASGSTSYETAAVLYAHDRSPKLSDEVL